MSQKWGKCHENRRPWKDHFKSDLRSDQDHRQKNDLRSFKTIISKKLPLQLTFLPTARSAVGLGITFSTFTQWPFGHLAIWSFGHFIILTFQDRG
jgi:hypothetical protein